MAKRFLVLLALLTLGFYVAGCTEGDDSSGVTNPNPNNFEPKGSISGVVFDSCLNAPVQGAVVSVAYSGSVHQVTTGATGAFGFNNVPANYFWKEYDGWDEEFGADDGYYVTCDLTKKTGYGYAVVEEVWLYFGDLGDGDNSFLGESSGQTEAGSGADTPVDGLQAGLEFIVAQPNASISGTIYDVTKTRVGTAATVALLNSDGIVLQTTTASAAGAYTFDNVIPGQSYYLLVTKAGYCYANDDFQTDGQEVSCNMFDLDCTPACAQDLAGVDVSIIYDPTRDITIPYIVSVDADDETDLIYDDNIDFQIDEFVVTFSEAMRDDRSVGNAIDVDSDFTVYAQSDGAATGSHAGVDIVDDFGAVMDSSGVLTITLDYDEAATIEHVAGALGWDEDVTEITGYDGSYSLTFEEYNIHLTDAALIPWANGSFSGYELSPVGWGYQNYFIFNDAGETLFLNAEF